MILNGTSTSADEQLAIGTIRTLSIDAVEQANSGHPGAPDHERDHRAEGQDEPTAEISAPTGLHAGARRLGRTG